MVRDANHRGQVELLVALREPRKIAFGEPKKGCSWSQAALLEMDESSGKLNERFKEIRFGSPAGFQPKILQHIVREIEILSVKTGEKAQVTRIQGFPLKLANQSSDFGALVTQFRRRPVSFLKAWTMPPKNPERERSPSQTKAWQLLWHTGQW